MLVPSRPQPFDGTEGQRQSNRATHDFRAFEGQWLCERCEAKPWHVAADYPCGVEPPRIPPKEQS